MSAAPFTYDRLPYFRAEEVRLWNWFHRVIPSGSDWQSWAGSAFSQLLLRPSRQTAFLTRTSLLEGAGEPERFPLDREEITIGRAPENRVVLPAKAIGKNHATILRREGEFYLEDLGNSFGTHVGSRKLEPHHPERLRDGDRFVIFPFEFLVSIETEWEPESEARVLAWPAVETHWSVFRDRAGPGFIGFPLYAEPASEPAYLEGNSEFFAELARRLLQPVRLDMPDATLLPCEESLLEFLLLLVLENANRAARFPFRVELGNSKVALPYQPECRGICTAFSVALSGLTGALRLFLPYATLEKLEGAILPPKTAVDPAGLEWNLPVSSGWVDLLPRELRGIELFDVLLLTSGAVLWLPGSFEKGWNAGIESDNPWRLRVENYFDRSARMHEGSASAQVTAPDLETLPVRLHVVVGQKEMTLADLNGLAPGTILELGTGKSEPVRLVANGKVVGEGELVEVDGKLGVRVLSWS